MKKKAAPAVSPAKETGSARVYAQLRADILRVKIMPGAPLDESSLSERFGLSRSPIREALVRLSSEGLVQILPSRSIVVAPIDFSTIPQFLDALDLLQRITTRSAALFRTDADLQEIKSAQADYFKGAAESVKTGDSLYMIEANYHFHMAVARAGRNNYFTSFYQRVLDDGRRILHFYFDYMRLDPGLTAEKLSEPHVEMIAAIEGQRPDEAERVAHEHAVQFKGRFMQFLMRSVSPDLKLDSLD